jgi:hypothetical protein
MVAGFTVVSLAVLFACVCAATLAGVMGGPGTRAQGRRVPVRIPVRIKD